ncbi:MAG: beta-ketoacyl-ACP synthase, partial [Rhodococcus sp. (in: high G+C Gram-positive bacteria)]|nr:beta-ketoacyl-ACP synthase [Rhodococcus sp. (in: high G+C Gram-positive bacteria)]MDX5454359.1 beta-ketoacyl-ACP synthase [Rhodococcus sp. (in: high G+C Gram-positive bacteria)]
MTSASPRTGTFPNVVVTSLAATTSIAGDVDATWKGLLAGESGIDTLTGFVDEFDLPVRIGGKLTTSPDETLSRVEIRRMSFVERLALHLGRTVWANAGSPE